MKFVAYALVALLCAPLAGCITPVNGPDGVGLAAAPMASLPRVKQAEANQQKWNEGMEGAVTSIAKKVDDEAAKLAVEKAALEKKLDDSVLEAQDAAQIDWLELALIALGIGGVGAGGVGGVAAYRRKLLNTPAPSKPSAKAS